MIGADDKPQALPPYSGPPPPQMHHRIPPEAAHGLVNAPGAYDQPWRPYPPSFEHHHAEQRRASNPPQPSLPPHGYPVIPNRELPQLPPEGPVACADFSSYEWSFARFHPPFSTHASRASSTFGTLRFSSADDLSPSRTEQ
ncbi:hypothetical protein CDV58_07994 [Aspergillus fumigatus]|nr:hypothetical protein CDV58_07994 [Aspergillus fumigatus]